LKKIAVAIDGFLAQEELQVAGQVSNHKQEQDEACHGHDVLLTQGRLKNVRNDVHQQSSPANPKLPGTA
jgi:hypothetical protein